MLVITQFLGPTEFKDRISKSTGGNATTPVQSAGVDTQDSFSIVCTTTEHDSSAWIAWPCALSTETRSSIRL